MSTQQTPVHPPPVPGSAYTGQPAASPAIPAPAAGATATTTGGTMSNQNLNQIVSVLLTCHANRAATYPYSIQLLLSTEFIYHGQYS